MKKVKLSEQLEVKYYDFSDYVICVDIFQEGKNLGGFCSERSQFNDLEEDEIKKLVAHHVTSQRQANKENKRTRKNRTMLSNGMEVEYYSHSDDLCCLNLFDEDKLIGSMCADDSSFEDWCEDRNLLEKAISKQLIL